MNREMSECFKGDTLNPGTHWYGVHCLSVWVDRWNCIQSWSGGCVKCWSIQQFVEGSKRYYLISFTSYYYTSPRKTPLLHIEYWYRNERWTDVKALAHFADSNKVAVVYFTAKWCGPCKLRMPHDLTSWHIRTLMVYGFSPHDPF